LAAAIETFSGSSVILGLRQGRTDAIQQALKTLTDEHADKTRQLQYVQILGEVSHAECLPILLDLAVRSADNALQAAAVRSLGRYDDARIPSAVLSSYTNMPDDVRQEAGALLTSRAAWTLSLLQAIDAHQFDKSRLSLDLVQRMMFFADDRVTKLVQKHWPDLKPQTTEALNQEIHRIANVLQTGLGQPKSGQAIYMQQCGKCHALFGEGGRVGPDLTAFRRDDIPAMLLSIVHPSAEIREGYNTYVVLTNDGRVLTGTLDHEDPQTVTLRSPEGALLTIARNEIDDMTTSSQSIMPEGLLNGYSDRELRDLFGYLRMTQPLID
jgi:putative heme-binding domain-containing protein